jgi:hypothetical protein
MMTKEQMHVTKSYRIFLYALINPLVDESCEVTGASFNNSGKIFPASTLPNSTPH